MRWLLASALVLSASPAFAQAQENEAEKLFRAMEKMIRGAKSLKVVYVVDGKEDQKPGKMNCTLYFAEGNKARVEIVADIPSFPSPLLMVSNGKEMASKSGKDPIKSEPTDPKISPFLLGAVARLGMIGPFAKSKSDKAGESKFPDIDIFLPASDFKLGIRERVGDREGQIVEYQVGVNQPGPDKAIVKVWIDLKSLTPLKRQMHDPERPMDRSFDISYSEFVINPQLDAKLFELPK